MLGQRKLDPRENFHFQCKQRIVVLQVMTELTNRQIGLEANIRELKKDFDQVKQQLQSRILILESQLRQGDFLHFLGVTLLTTIFAALRHKRQTKASITELLLWMWCEEPPLHRQTNPEDLTAPGSLVKRWFRC